MAEENKDFEALWARDANEVIRKSASIKAVAEWFFTQGERHGETKGMRDFALQDDVREVDTTAARAI